MNPSPELILVTRLAEQCPIPGRQKDGLYVFIGTINMDYINSLIILNRSKAAKNQLVINRKMLMD